MTNKKIISITNIEKIQFKFSLVTGSLMVLGQSSLMLFPKSTINVLFYSFDKIHQIQSSIKEYFKR